MEHLLLRGKGEIYLPFARSRIKALKALGLPYAGQKFEIEGVSVKVRIEPGHEYIQIEGGAELILDSGIVGLGGVGEMDPARYLSGVLYKSTDVLAYDAGNTKKSGKNKLGHPLYTTEKSAAGLQLGRVTGHFGYPGLIGRVPQDGKEAESFARRRVKAEDGALSEDERDETLFFKKLAAVYCPASMFTGRLRLYVQSLYGSPLYRDIYGASGPKPNLVWSSWQAPYLLITPYVDPKDVDENGDIKAYQQVPIFKECGIYFDPVSFRHHLISINFTTVHVYPMYIPANARSLVKLLDPNGSGKDLSEDERRHVEAYILSVSVPNASRRRTLNGPEPMGASCGYGWHWNWSGDKADMIYNGKFPQPGGDETEVRCWAMESSHLRLTLTRVPTTKIGPDGQDIEDKEHPEFKIEQTVLEDRTRWSIHQHKWCIAYPAWDFTLEKLTPQITSMFECDGPFYAFYLGDDLQVCRVKVARKSSEVNREMSPHYTPLTTPVYGEYARAITLGMQDGFRKDTYPNSLHWEVTFSCGSYVGPTTTFEKWDAIVEDRVFDKSLGAWDESGSGSGNGIYTGPMNVGDPNPPATETAPEYLNQNWGTASVDGEVQDADNASFSVSTSYTNGLDSYNGVAEVVIPMFDAEAVLFDCEETLTRDRTTSTVNYSDGLIRTATYLRSNRVNAINRETLVLTGSFTRYTANYWSDFSPSGYGSIENTSETTVEHLIPIERAAKLVCKAGVLDAEMMNISYFHYHTKPDVIPNAYACRTGVGPYSQPALTPAIAQFLTPSMNTGAQDYPPFPAIVGWA